MLGLACLPVWLKLRIVSRKQLLAALGCRSVGLARHENDGLKVVNLLRLDLFSEQLEQGSTDIPAVLENLVLHGSEGRICKGKLYHRIGQLLPQ